MFICDWKHTIYLPVAAANKKVSDNMIVLEGVLGLTRSYFGGYTYWKAKGGWDDHTGKMHKEPTYVIETITHRQDEDRQFQHITDFILGHSKEKEILITKSPVTIKTFERKDYHD